MKDFIKRIDFTKLTGRLILYIVAVVSGYINFGYGYAISIVYGAMFVAFSACEIYFPSAASRSKYRAVAYFAYFVTGLLVVISMTTALFTVTAKQQERSDNLKGVYSSLQSKVSDADLAQREYMLALESSKYAQNACRVEQDRNRQDPTKGFVRRRCSEARQAAEHAEKLRLHLSQLRTGVDEASSKIVNPSEAGSVLIERLIGVSADFLNVSFTSVVSMIFAALVSILALIIMTMKPKIPREAVKSHEEKNTATKGGGGGPKGGGGKKPSTTKKPQSKPDPVKLPDNVTPIGSAKKSNPKASMTAAEKSKFEKDLARAAELVSKGKLKESIRDLSSKKAKRMGLKVGTSSAKQIIESLKLKASSKEDSVSE